MNFFGKGKKGGSSKRRGSRQPMPQQPVVDFSSPDAFSEENMAKMSGVDTMTFDENDPALMAELAELGWGGDESSSGGGGGRGGGGGATAARPPRGHRPRPDMAGGREDSSGGPARQHSGNELLRSLGLSLNSLGDPELTEEDLQDPDLLGELGEVSGGLEFGDDDGDDDDEVEPDREGGDGVEGDEEEEEEMLASNDVEEEEAARPARPALPPRDPLPAAAPSSSSGGGSGASAAAGEIARLEREVDVLRHRAMELKKAGDRAAALEALRAARSADHELAVLRTLETTRKVATVRTEYETPYSDEDDQEEEQEEEEQEEEDDDEAPTPSPAGAGAGGGGGKPVSAELLMQQVKVLYQRAVELKKEGRTAEAMACLKRAKSLEADLVRDAQGKGLISEGDGEGRRPSLLRQGSVSRRSSAGSVGNPAPAAARGESRSESRAGLPASVKSSIKPKVRSSTNQEPVHFGQPTNGPRHSLWHFRIPAWNSSNRVSLSHVTSRRVPTNRSRRSPSSATCSLHMGRAKSLVKKDRAAAAKEVKRCDRRDGDGCLVMDGGVFFSGDVGHGDLEAKPERVNNFRRCGAKGRGFETKVG
ncbi:unnamed protein product [Scytosiphon promiscuus]